MKTKLSKKFYLLVGFIGLLILLSQRLFNQEVFTDILPYFLSLYFIGISVLIYFITKTLKLRDYLFASLFYLAFFILSLIADFSLNLSHPYFIGEIFIQLSMSLIPILIGYGISFIIDKFRV